MIHSLPPMPGLSHQAAHTSATAALRTATLVRSSRVGDWDVYTAEDVRGGPSLLAGSTIVIDSLTWIRQISPRSSPT